MNRIVALGEPGRVAGFRLAGATVIEAQGGDAIDRAWQTLPDDTRLLILSPAAADRLRSRLTSRAWFVWAVMPR